MGTTVMFSQNHSFQGTRNFREQLSQTIQFTNEEN